MAIQFSQAAIDFIKAQLAREKAHGIRLTIKKTGCSGYAYDPQIIHQVNAEDACVKIAPDLMVYLDPAWLAQLNALTVDCIQSSKTNLKQKKLVFMSPQEAARCGCGESFTWE